MTRLALLLALAAPLIAADGPRLFYSKAFPGSSPAYVQIDLASSGAAEYREAPDDDSPLAFQLAPAETSEVFSLADKLGHFQTPLESPAKVAFMGKKTFGWENGSEKHRIEFNYSEDPGARQLWDWFERMAESAQLRINLDRAAKYDKLGVFKAVTQLGVALDQKRLVGAQQYLPTLDRIVKNESYMHTARVRAAEIAEAIRTATPPAQ